MSPLLYIARVKVEIQSPVIVWLFADNVIVHVRGFHVLDMPRLRTDSSYIHLDKSIVRGDKETMPGY